MQEKINKQYIEAKVNPVIEPMTVALFNENQIQQDVVSNISIKSELYQNVSDLIYNCLFRFNSCLIISKKILEIVHLSMKVRGWNLNSSDNNAISLEQNVVVKDRLENLQLQIKDVEMMNPAVEVVVKKMGIMSLPYLQHLQENLQQAQECPYQLNHLETSIRLSNTYHQSMLKLLNKLPLFKSE